jgi:hypothetical protein
MNRPNKSWSLRASSRQAPMIVRLVMGAFILALSLGIGEDILQCEDTYRCEDTHRYEDTHQCSGHAGLKWCQFFKVGCTTF